MKASKIFLLMFLFLLACWSCGNQADNEKPEIEKPPEVEKSPEIEMPKEEENPKEVTDSPLVGYLWKLVGVAETETGNIKVLEPRDCEDCYTLTFITDSTLLSAATSYSLIRYYTANYEKGYLHFERYTGSTGDETGDGDVWWDFFPIINTFFFQENELRLYISNQKYLLLQKRKICNVENPLEDLSWLRELVKLYTRDGDIQSIYKCTYNNNMDGFYIVPNTYCIPLNAILYTCDGIELDRKIFDPEYDDYDEFHKKWNIKNKLEIWLDIT